VSTKTSAPSAADRPTVFLSYSHKDKKWLGELRTMLAPLVHDCLVDIWWDSDIKPSDHWREEIDKALASSRIGVLLVSRNFLASDFIKQKELPYLVNAARERRVALFWILLSPCLYEYTPLAEIQAAHEISRPIRRLRPAERDAVLKAVCLKIAAEAKGRGGRLEGVPRGGLRLDLGRLPIAGPLLIGRETELARLNAAWEDPGLHILTFVGFGGMGKSALVSHWLDRIAADGWRGARRVFDWSFYEQGTEERGTSADAFLEHALAWFGDPDPKAGSAWERGLRLAELVRAEKTLLVLDGVESLQHPLTSPLAGRLKDPGLAAMLKGLAHANPGLCLITTRERIADLELFQKAAPHEVLEALALESGAELLRQLGVKGKDADLLAASEEFGNHPLTLTLLGGYLSRGYGGDIRRRKEVDLARYDDDISEFLQVIGAYAAKLGEGPELAVLRLLGLFDRPADPKALEALQARPAMPGLTEPLMELEEEAWHLALSNLREHGLLLPADPHQPGTLDAHPLVRVFFRDALEEKRPEAWRAGNLRLYEHFQKVAPDLPDTLEDMEPLFTAVVHGCRAGQQQEALEEVYYRRILRGPEHFSWKKLGSFGSDLSALSGFFDRPWDKPSAGITAAAQTFVLNQAGLYLRALGRPDEAVQPAEASLEAALRLEDWKEASRCANNLSDLTLNLGEVERAVAFGKRSVDLADRSGDASQRMIRRTTLADALHQAGYWDESADAFREAEALQEKRQPQYPRLHSLPGYRYCDLLLNLGEPEDGSVADLLSADPEATRRLREMCQEVRKRAEQTLGWFESRYPLLSLALDHLSLGRAHLGLALTAPRPAAPAEGAEADFAKAAEHLDYAVEGLRQAGTEDELPLGLLARAAWRRLRGDLPAAEADLSEALEIAERGSMRLHECDAHLEWARLCRQQGNRDGLERHVARARKLVEETGYGRRRREVEWIGSKPLASELSPLNPI